MSQSPFAHSLFASTCVAGIIFSATTLPFTAFKSNVVNVELQNQPIFTSELKYLAAPYLTVAGGISIAVGVGVFGVLGWRHSANKLAGSESSKEDLAKSLTAYQSELERIKFSESRLRTQQLSAFLQPSELASRAPEEQREPVAVVQPQSIVKPLHRSEQQLDTSHHLAISAQPNPATIAHSKSYTTGLSRQIVSEVEHEPFENLLSQLHHLSRQVEDLKNSSSSRLAA
ncbi:MAG: hypothetical protein ACKO21_09505 [Nodosilinea sp.]|jgi:hypothetical protein